VLKAGSGPERLSRLRHCKDRGRKADLLKLLCRFRVWALKLEARIWARLSRLK
jgi:hypothetical protein